MTGTASAPLPREEIFDRCCRTATMTVEQWRNELDLAATDEDVARLKGFVAAAYCNLFTALLAEIKAGRAGAERVTELRRCLNCGGGGKILWCSHFIECEACLGSGKIHAYPVLTHDR
jgi:hypothetical protein